MPGPDLYAVVWHPPGEQPDGRDVSIVADRDEAIEDASYYQEQCRRAGRPDRYVAYRLAPLEQEGADR
jgi:hypothetical protein